MESSLAKKFLHEFKNSHVEILYTGDFQRYVAFFTDENKYVGNINRMYKCKFYYNSTIGKSHRSEEIDRKIIEEVLRHHLGYSLRCSPFPNNGEFERFIKEGEYTFEQQHLILMQERFYRVKGSSKKFLKQYHSSLLL